RREVVGADAGVGLARAPVLVGVHQLGDGGAGEVVVVVERAAEAGAALAAGAEGELVAGGRVAAGVAGEHAVGVLRAGDGGGVVEREGGAAGAERGARASADLRERV